MFFWVIDVKMMMIIIIINLFIYLLKYLTFKKERERDAKKEYMSFLFFSLLARQELCLCFYKSMGMIFIYAVLY